MSNLLDILPVRTGGAAENMATDFLLLQRYPDPARARFRHYEWRGPAFTFGYSQKVASVRSSLRQACGWQAGLPEPDVDLCRRPTGGGVVDHRDDWTYSLVIPRGHPLEEMRAGHSYRLVHVAIQNSLRAQGASTKLVEGPPAEGPPDICFERAEAFDVVHEKSGAKIAGAAQKRNKQGLLFQGSIWKPSIAAGIDWEQFHDKLVAEIARLLEVEAAPTPWPDLNEDELSALIERYESPEWMEFR